VTDLLGEKIEADTRMRAVEKRLIEAAEDRRSKAAAA